MAAEDSTRTGGRRRRPATAGGSAANAASNGGTESPEAAAIAAAAQAAEAAEAAAVAAEAAEEAAAHEAAAAQVAARAAAAVAAATKDGKHTGILTDEDLAEAMRIVSNERARGLTHAELEGLLTSREFIRMLAERDLDVRSIRSAVRYERELGLLQIELVKLQRWVQETGARIAIIFEGRDAAGKGGTIRRFTEHLNPRAMRVVALPKPTDEELGQWYFQRYMRHLPNAGEIVFFDRSWYNRAVVEPVNGFCTHDQYERFMRQVPEFEHMLTEDGVMVIKFWFSIAREEQLKRFASRRSNPLKQWKLSPLDRKAQDLWDKYTKYKEATFSRTHTSFSPWVIVHANSKKRARLESIRYVLSQVDYDGKDEAGTSLLPDPEIVTRYHRAALRID